MVVVGLLADFLFAVDGVGGRGVAWHETGEDGALMQGEGFVLFRGVVRLAERKSDTSG